MFGHLEQLLAPRSHLRTRKTAHEFVRIIGKRDRFPRAGHSAGHRSSDGVNQYARAGWLGWATVDGHHSKHRRFLVVRLVIFFKPIDCIDRSIMRPKVCLRKQ
ncbi:hypothetical protein APY04_0477 [Hyphomicrobium sulfonivorans]|uniref:Uncharacterized protein n=1 Tax=Hyphomicrobium sulfonivorans TaxID=121290 RepID=A0A109BM83_HYPSL|nr:hypothetical protein APY04_0477 [Hyphomicrobium sulfonivorans]